MLFKRMLNLQLFGGEGAAGGEGGASSGDGVGNTAAEPSADAGQNRLRELGVPEDKIRRRAMKPATVLPKGAVTTTPTQNGTQEKQDAAADPTPTEENSTQTEEKASDTPARLSWDEIMADPEYNKRMQETIKSRLKASRGAEEALTKLTPALEVLARAHKMDMDNLDYEALAKAISDDSRYYEDKALELGTSVDTAKKLDQMERQNARQQREAAITLEKQKIAQHFVTLERQAEAMKTVFPNFDLRTELTNPVFARMTSPNIGLSVEDAYYAVHRNEIQAAAMKATAEKTAEKLSNAIRAGGARPIENGTSGTGASVTKFDYRKASPEQRAALKKEIRDAAARGEKLYPGR